MNDDIAIRPYSSKYKIYIIADADLMTVQAQNALLKTIEEPPSYAVIMLLTENAEVLLPTIRSRCVMMKLRNIKDQLVKKYLMEQMEIRIIRRMYALRLPRKYGESHHAGAFGIF